MAREVPDIEASLQLCKDMDSPSIVIPVSVIEKHFSSPPPPGYSGVPCYDMGELIAWAKEKGWSVTLATTGTMTDKKIVPGIRFSPLLEKNSIPSATPNPTSDISNNEKNWQNNMLYYIAIGVTIAVLAFFVIDIMKKHLDAPF